MFRRLTTLTVSRASTTGTPVASLINAAIGGFAANQLVGVNTKKAAVSPKAKTKLSASPQKKQPVTSKPLTKKKTLAKKKVVSTKKKASAKKKIAPKKKAAIGKKKAVAKKKAVTVKKKATTKKATKKKAVTKKKSILKKKTVSKKKTIKKKALTKKKKSVVKKKLAAKRKVTKKLAKKKKPLVKKKAALKKKAKTTALALVPTKATKVALIAQLDKERAARRRVERRLDSITTKYRELLAELSAIREIANNLILENKQQLADRRAKEIDAGGTPATLLPPHPAGISDDLAAAPKSITSGEEDNNSSSSNNNNNNNNIESLLSDSTGVLETVEPASPAVDVVEQQDAEDDLLLSTSEPPMKEEAVKSIGKETKGTDWSSPPPLKRETPSPYEQFTSEVWNDEELLDQKMADFGTLSDPSLQKYNKNPAEMRYHAKKKTVWRLWGESVEKSTPSAPATAPTATSRGAAARHKVTPPPMILDDFSDLLTAASTRAQPYVEEQPEVVVAAEKTQQDNEATTQSQKAFTSAEEKKKTAVKTQSKKKEEKSSSLSSSVKRDRETPKKAQMGKMNEKSASKKDNSTATSRPAGKKSQSPSIAAEKESKSSAKPNSAGVTKVLKAEKESPKEKAQTEKKKEKAITPSSSVGTKKNDLSKEESEFKKFAQEMWMSSELSKKMKAVGSYKSSFVTSLSKEEGSDGGKEFHAKLHGMAALWKERQQRNQTKQQQSSEKGLGLDKCKKWVLTAMNEELDGAL